MDNKPDALVERLNGTAWQAIIDEATACYSEAVELRDADIDLACLIVSAVEHGILPLLNGGHVATIISVVLAVQRRIAAGRVTSGDETLTPVPDTFLKAFEGEAGD